MAEHRRRLLPCLGGWGIALATVRLVLELLIHLLETAIAPLAKVE